MISSSIFVGVDNSDLTHSVTILDDEGFILSTFTINNSYDGFQELCSRLASYSSVYVAFEMGHGPLIDYLQTTPFKLFSLNPLMVKRFKQTYLVSGNKTDSIDSYAIALYAKVHRDSINQLCFSSNDMEMLTHLTVIHDQLTESHTYVVQQLITTLKRYFPLYSRLFSRYSLPIVSYMIIKYPKWEDLEKTTDEELRMFLFKHHYPGRFIDQFIAKIRSYQQLIAPAVQEVYSLKAVTLAREMIELRTGLDETEKRMNELTDKHPLGRVIRSLPGGGKILAPEILAAFGDNKAKFRNYNDAQCYFGTAPRNYQSGKIHRVIMRKACNHRLKNIFYQFAFVSIGRSPWSRQYYNNQRKKGKTNSVALRALSNKWVKIIYFLWLRGELYSENKRMRDQLRAIA